MKQSFTQSLHEVLDLPKKILSSEGTQNVPSSTMQEKDIWNK